MNSCEVVNSAEACYEGLAPRLAWLDYRLAAAAGAAAERFGPGAASDPLRGLYVSDAEAERLLDQPPGDGVFFAGEDDPGPGHLAEDCRGSTLATLAAEYGLSEFEARAMVVALAPEIDLKYERLFAYLQDDVSRKRPTVDLVLNLLCGSAAQRVAARARFGPGSTLVGQGLIRLLPDPNQPQPPLLAHTVKLDDHVVGLLLGDDSLDPRLAGFVRRVMPTRRIDALAIEPGANAELRSLGSLAREGPRPLIVSFEGRPGYGQDEAAEALAAEAGLRLLVVDWPRAAASPEAFVAAIPVLLRTARLQRALIHVAGFDPSGGAAEAAGNTLLSALAQMGAVAVFETPSPWSPSSGALGAIPTVRFDPPGFALRRDWWVRAASARDVRLDDATADELARRFRLSAGHVASAIDLAVLRAGPEPPGPAALFRAARRYSARGPEAMARRIAPAVGWDDLVLPPEKVEQLHELCDRARNGHVVFDQWGLGRSLGNGLCVLFTGLSGTGKTLAAEVMAGALGLDLLKIDLSRVVSKYIGETEKHLDRVFDAAERSHSVLFFDEADALFGRRSQVRDAHDRYANIEVGYLLQKVEEYRGLAVLATNLPANLDDAFVRRLTDQVEFPFPEEPERLRIWDRLLAPGVPRADDIDLPFLARQFRLAGGSIRNAVLAAAFRAASGGRSVGMGHLLRGVRREYLKMGRSATEDEFGEFAHRLKEPEDAD